MSSRKTHEQFVSQVKHLPITVVGRYKGNRQKIEIKCDECGHKWKMRVDHVIAGKRCPVCSRLAAASKQSKPRHVYAEEMKKKDITVIGEYVNRKTKVAVKCDKCGREWEIMPYTTKSCALCSRKTYPPEITADYGEWVEFAVRGGIIKIDKLDFVNIVKSSVYVDSRGYPTMLNPKKRGTHISLHKLIMDGGDGLMVDHIDRDPCNNRRKNLRYVTRSQNAMNSKCRSDSKSGIRGVSLRGGKTKRWIASIHANGETHYLGSFSSLSDAKIARKGGEERYFGEYAPNNAEKNHDDA